MKTFFVTGGAGLATSASSTTLTINLDIDGMTDIGAALADADLLIVDDGAGGTNRKATMTRLAAYIAGKTKRQEFVPGTNLTIATGVLAASGTLGILIPPSLIFIFYGLFFKLFSTFFRFF